MGRPGSLLILSILLGCALGAWQGTLRVARRQQERRFHREAREIATAFRERLQDYELVLGGARGLFAQGAPVTPGGWAAYCRALNLEQARPGIQGLGFTRRLAPGEGPALEAALRRGGRPGFHIWPSPGTAESTIVLLHPMEGRNLRALGFDMRSEPVRRAAMDRARESGGTTLSGKVTLVQEDGRDLQAGVLMYLPVFTGEPREGTRPEVLGWIYSPFRMGDFSRATLGSAWPGLRVEVFDGEAPGPEALLYGAPGDEAWTPRFTQLLPVPLPQHRWTLRLSSRPSFEQELDRQTPLLVLASGVTISLLIYSLLEALLRVQRRAQVLASRMTTALREEQQRLTRILDSTSEGIYGLDLEGRCTFVNQAYLRIHRCSAAEVLGRSTHQAAHYAHPDGTPYPVETCPIYRALHAGRHLRLEGEWFWRADGSGYWADVMVAPILEEGRATGSVVTLEDVTHKRAADQAKHDFISVVSHELRTPLTSIRGALGLLASGRLDAQPGEARRLLEVALRNSDRLGTLINDILDFEKLRSGRLPLHPEAVGVRDLLAEAQEVNLPFAAARGVMLRCAHRPQEARVLVDRGRMVQVLTNLLSNAVKFSPPGGEVWMDAELVGDQVHLRVIDQGQGIPEAFRPHLFEPFSQAEAPETRSSEGSGLGLSITKALVEDMGGRLSFTSDLGRGTTFTVAFPALVAPRPQP